MIHNLHFIKDDLLLKLQESQYTFYLGGSRRMEQLCLRLTEFPDKTAIIISSDDTDYDLYATYSKQLEQFLCGIGFEESFIPEQYYDNQAVKIMKNKENTIQIVLRFDAEFYKRVFESIDPWFYYTYLWKSSPVATYETRQNIRQIFNMLFDIAGNKTNLEEN